MEKLINLLYQYDYAYYVINEPLVTDDIYDGLKLKLINKENELNIPEEKRYSSNIGFKSLHDDLTHVRKMYSMDQVYNLSDLNKFITKISSYTDYAIVDYKNDGIAIEIVYRNGNPYLIGTRGSGGEVGLNVTKNVLKLVPDLPKVITSNMTFEVYGELILKKSYYKKYGKHADLRSIVGGLVSRKGELDAVEATFIAYDLYVEDKDYLTYEDKLKDLKSMGFTISDHALCELKSIELTIGEFLDKKDDYPYETDGICVKVDPIVTREAMGVTKKFPKCQMAYKWTKPPVTTTLKEVIWEIGPKRTFTPSGIIDAINTGNRKYTKVNLHSYFNIQSKELCLNDQILVQISGGLIPKVLCVTPDNENSAPLPIIPPKKCPYCSSDVVNIGKHLYCSNVKCPEAKVKELATKKKRLTKAHKDLLRVLYRKGFIEDFSEIKTVDFEDISCYYLGKLDYGKKILNALQTML